MTSDPLFHDDTDAPLKPLHTPDLLHTTSGKRRSAQKAGSLMKHYSCFMEIGSDQEESEKSSEEGSDYKAEESSDSSGGEEEGEEEEGSASSEISDGDCVKSEGFSGVGRRHSHSVQTFNLVKAFKDWWKDQEKVYSNKLEHLGVSTQLSVSDHTMLSAEIRVNEEDLKCLESVHQSKTYIGYTGGTPLVGAWVPKTNYLILGVSTQEHILKYKNVMCNRVQVWKLDEASKSLSFCYMVNTCAFSNLIIYPYPSPDIAHICISAAGKVIMYGLPLSISNLTQTLEFEPVRSFIISPSSTVEVTSICWSLVDGRVSLLGGTSNGFLLKWRVSAMTTEVDNDSSLSSPGSPSSVVLADQKILTHPGYPVSCISVCPQDQTLVITTSPDSRLKMWNLLNPQTPFLIKTRANKQMLLCSDVHWFHYWNSVVCLGDHITSNPQQSGNNLYVMYKDFRQSGKEGVLLQNSRVVPPSSGVSDHIRCFDFSDVNSAYVAGFHNGLTCVWDCPEPYSNKKHPVLFYKPRYLQCRSGLKETDFYKTDYLDDQDLLNQYWFKLETEFSQSVFPTLKNATIMSKSINGVTLAKWTNFDVDNMNTVCIGYMNGLIQVMKVPNIN